MSAPPPKPAGGKPPPPRMIVLADAKVTIGAPIPKVFEALLNPEQLGQWWATEVHVEAEQGGVYEGTLPEGRVEGTITRIDGPGKVSFMWNVDREGGAIETTVAYELAPKGAGTFVHLVHRALGPVPGDWSAVWNRALGSLKAFLEAGTTESG